MHKFLLTLLLLLSGLSFFAQTLIAVNPNTANAGQTLNVTITGANTHFAQGSETFVYFWYGQGSSTLNVNSVSANNNNSLVVNVSVPPNAFSGNYGLSTYNDIDGYLFLETGLFVNGIEPPSITSISPNSANAGQTLNVSITGSNTHFSQGSGTFINFEFYQGSSTFVVNSINVLSDNSMLANVYVPTNVFTGSYDVSVYNPIDGEITLNNGFYVNGIDPPSISDVSPNSGNAGQTLNVTITGTNTHFIQGSDTFIDFSFNQGSSTNSINYIDILSETSLVANITIPANTYTGYYDLYLYNFLDGLIFLEDAFYVNGFVPPSIASIVPNNAIAGATLDVTINGSNTHFSEGNNTFLDFGFNQGSGTIINSLSIPDNITLIANITVPPDAIDGSYDVYLSNSIDGFLYAPGGFNLGLVGMNMINPEISFTVYPNPTAGDLTLENHSKQIAHDAYFSVYNQKGQLVLKQQLKDERTNINLDSHSSGYYFIVLNNSPGTLIYKILKE